MRVSSLLDRIKVEIMITAPRRLLQVCNVPGAWLSLKGLKWPLRFFVDTKLPWVRLHWTFLLERKLCKLLLHWAWLHCVSQKCSVPFWPPSIVAQSWSWPVKLLLQSWHGHNVQHGNRRDKPLLTCIDVVAIDAQSPIVLGCNAIWEAYVLVYNGKKPHGE